MSPPCSSTAKNMCWRWNLHSVISWMTQCTDTVVFPFRQRYPAACIASREQLYRCSRADDVHTQGHRSFYIRRLHIAEVIPPPVQRRRDILPAIGDIDGVSLQPHVDVPLASQRLPDPMRPDLTGHVWRCMTGCNRQWRSPCVLFPQAVSAVHDRLQRYSKSGLSAVLAMLACLTCCTSHLRCCACSVRCPSACARPSLATSASL